MNFRYSSATDSEAAAPFLQEQGNSRPPSCSNGDPSTDAKDIIWEEALVIASVSEDSPLLHVHGGSGPSSSENEDDLSTMTIFWQEMRKIGLKTGPLLATQLAAHSIAFVPAISAGHLSTNALAATSLAGSTAAGTGISILVGISVALDTLLPPAWTSPHPHLMGLWTQRAAVIMAILTLPIGLIWFNSEKIFALIPGQDKEVIHLASVYLRYLFIGIPAYGFNQLSKKYFYSQQKFGLQNWIVFFGAFINILFNYLLVWGPKPIRLGYIGAAISVSISSLSTTIVSLVYGIYFVSRKAWHPLTSQMFTKLGVVIRLGFAGICQVAARMWAWEIMSLSASTFGSVILASQSILVRTTSAFTADAVGTAAASCIGNLVGEKKTRRAKIAVYVSMILAFIVNFVTCVILLSLRHSWAYIFNNSQEIADIVARTLPLITLYLLGDGSASVAAAILRVRGDQFTAAVLNISGYYFLGLPLGLYLTFKQSMSLSGLWIGVSCAVFYNAIVGTYLCLRTDWNQTVDKVARRLEAEESSRSVVTDEVQIVN